MHFSYFFYKYIQSLLKLDNYTCLQTNSTPCLSTPAKSTPDDFPGKNLVRQSLPREKNLDFLTSSTILDNLVYPRENTEAVVQRCSVKKVLLENFTKFTGKHLCQSLFFDKVAGLRAATLLKKRLWHRCFPANFVKFLRTPFLRKTPHS